jgi:hypothetical protein
VTEHSWGPAYPARPRLAKSLRVLGHDVDRVWPGRQHDSDGWIGDASHRERQSDHNPDPSGVVHAIDLDVDGIRPWVVVVAALAHPSTNYVVFRGHIWARSHRFHQQPYNGQDPHLSHVHVSILTTRRAETRRTHWLPDISPQEVAQRLLMG